MEQIANGTHVSPTELTGTAGENTEVQLHEYWNHQIFSLFDITSRTECQNLPFILFPFTMITKLLPAKQSGRNRWLFATRGHYNEIKCFVKRTELCAIHMIDVRQMSSKTLMYVRDCTGPIRIGPHFDSALTTAFISNGMFHSYILTYKPNRVWTQKYAPYYKIENIKDAKKIPILKGVSGVLLQLPPVQD